MKKYTKCFLVLVALLMQLQIVTACTSETQLDESLPQQVVSAPVVVSTSEEVSSVISEVVISDGEVPTAASNNLFFTEEELAKLNTMLDEWAAVKEESEEDGSNVAVFFRDIESGLTYTYNGDKVFMVASLNKAPYAMYLYHLVETGQASLDETFHVTEAMLENWKENSGKLKELEDLPKDFTLSELIGYMLRYSDTAALRIVLSKYGAAGYTAYLQEVGVPTDNVRSVTNGRITANEAGAYLQAMQQFIETSAYGDVYKQGLMYGNYNMIRPGHTRVGKYGWDTNAYHDMAIIYAPHPYQIAILTDKDEGSWQEFSMFSKIARTLEDMVAAKYA